MRVACVFMPVPSQLEDDLVADVDAGEARRRGVDVEQVIELFVAQPAAPWPAWPPPPTATRSALISLRVRRVKVPSPMRVGTRIVGHAVLPVSRARSHAVSGSARLALTDRLISNSLHSGRREKSRQSAAGKIQGAAATPSSSASPSSSSGSLPTFFALPLEVGLVRYAGCARSPCRRCPRSSRVLVEELVEALVVRQMRLDEDVERPCGVADVGDVLMAARRAPTPLA